MVALTSAALFALALNPLGPPAGSAQQISLLILVPACATLLVMSLLHADLQQLYSLLAAREAQAQTDARRDALTGLGNRKLLVEELEARLKAGASDQAALLLVDLNHFKRVNDTLGHGAGDQLIIAVASRIKSILPEAITARLGGDEFAAIVEVADKRELEPICESLKTRLSSPFQIGGTEVLVGGSVGVALFEHGLNASDLLRRADVAMYRAKSTGSGCQIFDAPMVAEIERRTGLANALHDYLNSGEGLYAVFQPIVTPDGDVRALEALLRWPHESTEDISPVEIIAIAEETHLLDNVDLVMARHASHAANLLPGVSICLNIRAVQLLKPQYGDKLARVVAEYDVAPARIQLEIQERELVERGAQIASAIASLHAAGFQIAVDDFGSSTSSLAHLKALGITTLKLDPSILNNAREAGSIAVMRANVSLAKALGMTVVCKGINSSLEEAAAIQAGCDLLQGFRYGRPAGIEVFLDQSRTQTKIAQTAG